MTGAHTSPGGAGNAARHRAQQRHHRDGIIAGALVLVGVAVIVGIVGLNRTPHHAPALATTPSTSTSSSPSGRGGSSGPISVARLGLLPALSNGPTGAVHRPAAAQPAVPVRLRIPSIGVQSALEPLRLEPDHTLEPPTTWTEAGWYADGIRPGAVGPAVIAGHVDSLTGPAIFYRLHDLQPGDSVFVTEKNGHELHFVVDTVRSYPKDAFPFSAVYGPTATPVLRLITCTGDFDWKTHNYLDNLVVSAHLAS